jgi:Recombinase zinc beta ribbon domain
VFRGKVLPGRHEAIIDEQTFGAVQAIVAERVDSQALKRGHPSDYMLSGALRCGRCRKAYVGTAAHGRKSRYHYYVCSTRYRYGTQVCDGTRLPMEVLEDAVVEEAGRRLASIRQQLAGARRSWIATSARSNRGSCPPRTAGNASSSYATGSRPWRLRS